jgi:hypothetical protein
VDQCSGTVICVQFFFSPFRPSLCLAGPNAYPTLPLRWEGRECRSSLYAIGSSDPTIAAASATLAVAASTPLLRLHTSDGKGSTRSNTPNHTEINTRTPVGTVSIQRPLSSGLLREASMATMEVNMRIEGRYVQDLYGVIFW